MNDQTPDPKLLARFRTGDKTAFDALYQRYAGGVFAFARRLTQTKEEAEDLTQETFVAAFRSAEGFRGNARMLTWLLGIASRRWRDNRRTPRPQTYALQDGDTETATTHYAPVEQAALATVSLEGALAQLDVPLREAFLLVAAHGLTHKEAAHILNAPVGTVKWRVAEAGRRLRVLLSDEPDQKTEQTQPETPAHLPAISSSPAPAEVSHVPL